MPAEVPFARVLVILEEHGWTLQKVWEPYRVFSRPGKLPILIPVHNRMVSAAYVEKINKIIRADADEEGHSDESD